ncbi:MAG: transposase [Thermodesulfobacteriota bacterium]|nr:transposase [Thermodesulfobacteriota bacterium]
MSRPLRIEYAGALYHIIARGNEGRPIYKQEGDYQKFLDTLSELPGRYHAIIHGYVLMGNHYHLLIETPKGNITRVMHFLNATYTGYFNKKYKRVGHLFQGRYKGILIEKESYSVSVSRYIHLNPKRAGLVKRPEEYRWSSYPDYIGKGKKKTWLTCEWILGRYSRDKAKARRRYKAFVEEEFALKETPFDALKKGLILGSDNFIDETKKKTGLKKHREIPESSRLTKSITYEDIITAVAKRFGVSEQEIREPGRRDNLTRRICLYLLRRHTDLTNAEIGGYFGIGYTAVSQARLRVAREMAENSGLKKTIANIEKGLEDQV